MISDCDDGGCDYPDATCRSSQAEHPHESNHPRWMWELLNQKERCYINVM